MTKNYECKRKNNKQMKKMMNEQKRILLFNLKINAWIIKKYKIKKLKPKARENYECERTKWRN